MKMMRINKTIFVFTALIIFEITVFLSQPFADIAANYRKALPFSESGMASYYSYECAANPMANGEPFDPEERTCASWFYDFGTVLTVTSLETGLSTEVVVTDRGPNKRLVKQGRIIDLSKKAFEDICELRQGLTAVEIKVKK